MSSNQVSIASVDDDTVSDVTTNLRTLLSNTATQYRKTKWLPSNHQGNHSPETNITVCHRTKHKQNMSTIVCQKCPTKNHACQVMSSHKSLCSNMLGGQFKFVIFVSAIVPEYKVMCIVAQYNMLPTVDHTYQLFLFHICILLI